MLENYKTLKWITPFKIYELEIAIECDSFERNDSKFPSNIHSDEFMK